MQDPPLPEPIPASYYAPAAAPAGGFAWPAAHVLVGWALVGGLVACVVLLFVLSRTPPPRAGGVAALRSLPPSPPVAVAPPPAPAEPSPEATPSPTRTPAPTPSPTAVPTPSPTAASVTILNGPLSARQGRSVTLQARTAPRTACTIDLGYPSAPDLDPATSDASGAVSWTWRVARSAPSGSWPVTVTCGGATAATRIVVM